MIEMIDVKKFVVVFLVLAAIASSSAFILLNSNAAPGSSISAPSQTGNPLSLGDAFAPLPGQNSENNNAPGISATATDPNNLTDVLTNSLLDNLVAVNPGGPQSDGNGNAIIAAPDSQTILDEVSSSSAVQNLKIPDWDFEAAEQVITVTTDTSQTAESAYGNALNNILNSDFVKTNLQSIVQNTNPSSEDLSLVNNNLDDAIKNINSLTVPSDLANFQKGLVKLLIYQKNIVALAQNAPADPMKDSLIFQAEQDKFNTAVQQFEDTLQNKAVSLAFPPEADSNGNGALNILQSLFGIHKAYALFGLGDIVFDPTLFARMVWTWVQNVLLQLFKNTIITALQNKVLQLIKNNGNPLFVQDWAGLLANSFNGAVGSALGQIDPGLCSSFSGDVSLWLKNLYPAAPPIPGGFSLNGAVATNCTLQNNVANPGAFYNNFDNGGWNGLAALYQPNNNAFGAFANGYDEAQILGNVAQNAAQNNAIAGQGSQGQQLCGNGKPPVPGAGCPDGSLPFTVTPGTALNFTLGRNLTSNIDLVVNATDITGVLATVATDLLQQLVTSGVNGLVGSIPSGSGAGPQPTPAPLPVSCGPAQTAVSAGTVISFGATGGNGNSYTWIGGGVPATGSGPSFSTTFGVVGNYTVTVTGSTSNGFQSSNCLVQVQ